MTTKRPVVSVCCITYNHEDFIGKAIESFLAQKTDFPFEILVYDDYSTDGTREILKKFELDFPDRIRVFYANENQYQKGVRLLNLRFNLPRARGEFIATCDGDDYWCDMKKLQKQVDFLRSNPDCASCFHDYQSLIEGELVRSDSYGDLKDSEIRILNQNDFLLRHIQFATLMFRSSVRFPKFSEMINGDVFVLAVLSEKGKSGFLNFIGSVYRHQSDGVFRQMTRVEQITSSIQSRKLIFPELQSGTREILCKRISKLYNELIFEGLRQLNLRLVVSSFGGFFYYKVRHMVSS